MICFMIKRQDLVARPPKWKHSSEALDKVKLGFGAEIVVSTTLKEKRFTVASLKRNSKLPLHDVHRVMPALDLASALASIARRYQFLSGLHRSTGLLSWGTESERVPVFCCLEGPPSQNLDPALDPGQNSRPLRGLS